jgi:VWFA-related protein
MKPACAALLALWLTSVCLWGQESATQTPTLTVRAPLVQVPVLVRNKAGRVVFELTGDDFVVSDNGVAQRFTVDADTGSQPLALAVVVETGGAGARHLGDYAQLGSILDALIGNVEHRVAVIGFDSAPHMLLAFSPNTADASSTLAHLDAGDRGAAILDAIAFAVEKLPAAGYRRAILLLSETIDQGSRTNLNEAVRLISDTNTAMYSFSFSSTRAAVGHEASKLNNDTPGPAHGCFSREGADPEYEGHYDKQVMDCISQLAPPLRLATMSFLAARSALHKKTAEAIAQLAGGENFHFHNAKDLKAGLILLSNDLPNYYVLSFRPSAPTAGLHALQVEVKERSLVVNARREYWIENDSH